MGMLSFVKSYIKIVAAVILCLAMVVIGRFAVSYILTQTTKEESIHDGKIMLSQTVPDPEMVEINPTNDGYYYIVYKPEGSVYIRDGKERSGKNTFPALHADGTLVTAWDLGVAEELGLGSRR